MRKRNKQKYEGNNRKENHRRRCHTLISAACPFRPGTLFLPTMLCSLATGGEKVPCLKVFGWTSSALGTPPAQPLALRSNETAPWPGDSGRGETQGRSRWPLVFASAQNLMLVISFQYLRTGQSATPDALPPAWHRDKSYFSCRDPALHPRHPSLVARLFGALPQKAAVSKLPEAAQLTVCYVNVDS